MNPVDYKRRKTKVRNKTTLQTEAKKTVKLLITTLSIMIVVLSTLVLATTSSKAQKGYTFQQEKLKNEELKDIFDNLTIKITKATAFSQVEESDKISQMEETEEKEYVTSEDNEVK
ncbi:hypothetical protein GF366_04340 [Candidatus Peregrinibacteria bacterium]|nr:hypothetical protein [Candidatus Peregrinibacteria bacterium]